MQETTWRRGDDRRIHSDPDESNTCETNWTHHQRLGDSGTTIPSISSGSGQHKRARFSDKEHLVSKPDTEIQFSTFVGFALVSCLFLDSFPGLPLSLTVPLVSADSTNEQTCNLLDGFSHRTAGLPDRQATRQGTTVPSCHLCLCPSASDGVLAGLGNLRFPKCLLLAVFHHVTIRTIPETVAFKLLGLASLVCPLAAFSCLPWSWQGRRHSWASLLTHARLLEGTFRSSVSVSQGSQWMKPAQQGDHGGSSDRSSGCTRCVSISRGSAHHRQISCEPLAALARVYPCLQPRPSNQLATARATSPTTACFSRGCEDHVCVSVVSMHRAPLQFWCYAHFRNPQRIFHERNQITMKLHVEICHVSPSLPRSNLLDVRLRNRLIVSVLTRIAAA